MWYICDKIAEFSKTYGHTFKNYYFKSQIIRLQTNNIRLFEDSTFLEKKHIVVKKLFLEMETDFTQAFKF